MSGTIDNRRTFTIFLVFYFLSYSVFPLTYTVSGKQAQETISAEGTETPGSAIAALMLGASLCGRTTSLQEKPGNDGTVSILIKKKRAIVPEGASEKLHTRQQGSGPIDCHDSVSPAAYSPNAPDAHAPGAYRGFNPLFTGHSPPLT